MTKHDDDHIDVAKLSRALAYFTESDVTGKTERECRLFQELRSMLEADMAFHRQINQRLDEIERLLEIKERE